MGQTSVCAVTGDVEGRGGEEQSHDEVWMLVFVPVPAGNVPSREKIGGGGEGSTLGRRSEAHLSLLSGHQGAAGQV